MSATRTVLVTPVERPSARAIRYLLVAASTAARVREAFRRFADSGQLGPSPDVTISRSTGARI